MSEKIKCFIRRYYDLDKPKKNGEYQTYYALVFYNDFGREQIRIPASKAIALMKLGIPFS